jgi:putative ABC transport system permease protein
MLLLSDYRHAARTLLRTPGFAMLTIATLGLGVGASTAIFSALYRLQFAPVPFEDADRLVNLARTRLEEGFFLSPGPDVVAAWQAESKTLEHVAYIVTDEQTLTESGEAAALRGGRATHSLFDALGVEPLVGRTFTPEEAGADAPVVVLSEPVWRTRFGADPGIVGTAIRIGGVPRTVIGVMPAYFARYADPFPRHEFWTPYIRREGDFGSALGVMHAGVMPDAVSAEMEQIALRVDTAASQQVWNYRAMPVVEMVNLGTRNLLPVLLGAVGLVLLIACANVASLMIVRLNARRRELAIRSALGARGRRILAGIAAEQVLLAFGAGVLGLLLAAWTMELIARFQPNGMPLLDTLALDPAVLAFAAVLLTLSIVASGILPAWAALRRDPADLLRSGGDRVTTGTHMRSVLVAGQIAVSVMLLVGAALLMRSYGELMSRDLGFEAEGTLAVTIALPEARYPGEQQAAFFADALEAIRSVPGVAEAALGGGVPPELGLLFATLSVDESSVGTEGISYVAGTTAAPGFLPTLGVRFLEGRDFNAGDAAMSAVIVNRSFVDRFWPGERGVGRRIKLRQGDAVPWVEIIGVIEDVRTAHAGPLDLQLFYPIEYEYPGHTLLLRADGVDPMSLLPAVRQIIARMDADLPIREVATLEQKLSESVSRERFAMVLLGVFAALALILTVVGLYGLVAYTVQQRVREIGIRVALGATSRSVRELFVSHGMRLVAIGLMIGVLGAVAAVSVLRSLIHGITVYDGASFAAAVALIAPAALLASWLPARRAARIDPIVTLKSE